MCRFLHDEMPQPRAHASTRTPPAPRVRDALVWGVQLTIPTCHPHFFLKIDPCRQPSIHSFWHAAPRPHVFCVHPTPQTEAPVLGCKGQQSAYPYEAPSAQAAPRNLCAHFSENDDPPGIRTLSPSAEGRWPNPDWRTRSASSGPTSHPALSRFVHASMTWKLEKIAPFQPGDARVRFPIFGSVIPISDNPPQF